MRQFKDVKSHIEQITVEILGLVQNESSAYSPASEDDLSLKRLDEYHSQLQALQKEKGERIHKVLDYVGTVHELCAVLGMDFFKAVTEVHPSLNDSTSGQSKSISNETLDKLARTVASLKQEKRQRIKKVNWEECEAVRRYITVDNDGEFEGAVEKGCLIGSRVPEKKLLLIVYTPCTQSETVGKPGKLHIVSSEGDVSVLS